MLVKLPLKSFSFFKVISGLFILVPALFYPSLIPVSLVILLVGRAHTLGAWFAMWRSNKLNWSYVSSILIIGVIVSYFGFVFTDLKTLSFCAYILFTFHFLYDEFDLQQEKRNLSNILSSLAPTFVTLLFLMRDFTDMPITNNIFFAIAFVLISIELIFLKEVNWFFINTKCITFFVLAAIFYNVSSIAVLNLFLVYHYFFWFAFPVYKMHTFKRSERDGFIMMLLIIVIISVFVSTSEIWKGIENIYISLRPFYVASIVHILLTAPFGYLFGLPKPKYEIS